MAESMEVDPRVHFAEDQFNEHENEIVCKYKSADEVDVHLGFLQVNHHYEISLHVPNTLSKELSCDPLQNLHVKLTEFVANGSGHDLMFTFHAHKERLMNETLLLCSSTDECMLKLVFHARVLGKGKGTPSLRDGIKCVGVDVDEDSGTDWQGFEGEAR